MKKLTLLLLLVSTSFFAQDFVDINENLEGSWIINDVTINGETFSEPEGNGFYKSWLYFNNDIFAMEYYEYCSFSNVDFPTNNSFTFTFYANPETEDFFTYLVCLLDWEFEAN